MEVEIDELEVYGCRIKIRIGEGKTKSVSEAVQNIPERRHTIRLSSLARG